MNVVLVYQPLRELHGLIVPVRQRPHSAAWDYRSGTTAILRDDLCIERLAINKTKVGGKKLPPT